MFCRSLEDKNVESNAEDDRGLACEVSEGSKDPTWLFGGWGCFKTRLLAGTVISIGERTCPVYIWPRVHSPGPLERNGKVLATPITLALQSLIQKEHYSHFSLGCIMRSE